MSDVSIHLPFVSVWLDATYVHVREHGQVISKAVVIATGCRADGYREVLGVDVGNSENETFWTEFLRSLVDRGLGGVKLVISDAHAGLRAAIGRVLQDAGWQRCRAHAKRNLLAVVRHQHRGMVSALISTIFAQPDEAGARAQLRAVVDQLATTEPKAAEKLEGREHDLLAYATFPQVHWSKLWSNNPIERLNRELKRRTDVVQIFPDPESVVRLIGALLCETNDELIASPRRYMAEATLADLATREENHLPSLPAVTG